MHWFWEVAISLTSKPKRLPRLCVVESVSATLSYHLRNILVFELNYCQAQAYVVSISLITT